MKINCIFPTNISIFLSNNICMVKEKHINKQKALVSLVAKRKEVLEKLLLFMVTTMNTIAIIGKGEIYSDNSLPFRISFQEFPTISRIFILGC